MGKVGLSALFIAFEAPLASPTERENEKDKDKGRKRENGDLTQDKTNQTQRGFIGFTQDVVSRCRYYCMYYSSF